MAYYITSDCIGCRQCINVCPVEAIRENNGNVYIVEEECIECGTCAEVCPVEAIQST